MNALSQAQRAYSSASAPTRTARGIEYEIIARITTRIRTAEAEGASGFSALAQALADNRKLWGIFVTEMASKTNPFPAELKSRIVYLAKFTNDHTSKVLARQATAAPLLDVNTAILRGLRGEKD